MPKVRKEFEGLLNSLDREFLKFLLSNENLKGLFISSILRQEFTLSTPSCWKLQITLRSCLFKSFKFLLEFQKLYDLLQQNGWKSSYNSGNSGISSEMIFWDQHFKILVAHFMTWIRGDLNSPNINSRNLAIKQTLEALKWGEVLCVWVCVCSYLCVFNFHFTKSQIFRTFSHCRSELSTHELNFSTFEFIKFF